MRQLVRVDNEPPVVMYLRVRNKDDHRELEWLLPQCTPLFVYADKDGRDWVRWSIPRQVADEIGFSGGCSCCGVIEDNAQSPEHAVLMDMAQDEVDWYLARAE